MEDNLSATNFHPQKDVSNPCNVSWITWRNENSDQQSCSDPSTKRWRASWPNSNSLQEFRWPELLFWQLCADTQAFMPVRPLSSLFLYHLDTTFSCHKTISDKGEHIFLTFHNFKSNSKNFFSSEHRSWHWILKRVSLETSLLWNLRLLFFLLDISSSINFMPNFVV